MSIIETMVMDKKIQEMWDREELIILATDYGQIEARVFGMASKDPVLCEYLWTDYDIHMVWAKKVIDVWSKTFKKRGGDLKAFRGDIKNEFVFPAFFGSSLDSIARSLEAPPDVIRPVYNEFWRLFKGVKGWQEEVTKFYDKHFYVETLVGRRRRGPLSKNMIINTPIQGTAADILCDAMNRLSELAQKRGDPFLNPVLNIHDDLTFFIPRVAAEKYISTIVREMVSVPYDFVNVPISVEVSVGRDWYAMKDVGKYRSDQVPGAICPKRAA